MIKVRSEASAYDVVALMYWDEESSVFQVLGYQHARLIFCDTFVDEKVANAQFDRLLEPAYDPE
jgi:hypothetical protein